MKPRLRLTIAAAAALIASQVAGAADPDRRMLDALRPLAGIVGDWKGTGTSSNSAGWEETVETTWGFRDSDGRVSFEWRASGGKVLKDAILTFDPAKKVYRFVVRTPSGKTLRFEGTPAGSQTLRLNRVDRAEKDDIDRAEVKLVRGGDKLVYAFARRVGTTSHQQVAQVELIREGAPLASFADGPRCVVTGGPGRVEVTHAGKTYHVACEATKALFLANPEKFLKAAAPAPPNEEP